MMRLLCIGLMQGCGACLDQITPTSSVYWRKANYDYDDDDFQVRMLNKAVQLCYVSIRHTTTVHSDGVFLGHRQAL